MYYGNDIYHDTKPLSEVLRIIKKSYRNSKKNLGLCVTAENAFMEEELSIFELHLFRNYWKDYTSTIKVFYRTKNGDVVETPESNWYAWIPNDRKSRIKWLNDHIKLNK